MAVPKTNPSIVRHVVRSGVVAVFILGSSGPAIAKTAPLARHTTPQAEEYRRTRHPFSPIPVTTTDALARLVRTNTHVRRLYARHFGVSEKRLTGFVANALSLQRIPRSRRVTNYCARPDGTIYAVQIQLKAGELVWATRSGLPILKWVCSNPLTKQLPGTKVPQALAANALSSPKKALLARAPSDDDSVESATALAQAPQESEEMPRNNVGEATPVVMPDTPPTLQAARGLGGNGTETISLRTANTPLTGTAPVKGTGTPGNLKVSQISYSTATLVSLVPVIEPFARNHGSVPVTNAEATLVDTLPAPEPGSHRLLMSAAPLVYVLRYRRKPSA